MRRKRSGGMQGLRGSLPTPLGLCQGFCTSSKPLEPLQAERLTLVQQWPRRWSNLFSEKPKLGTSLQEFKAQTRAGDQEEGWWHGHRGKGSEPLTTQEHHQLPREWRQFSGDLEPPLNQEKQSQRAVLAPLLLWLGFCTLHLEQPGMPSLQLFTLRRVKSALLGENVLSSAIHT